MPSLKPTCKEHAQYEIDVEVPESTLRRYGLSLQDVAEAIRRENLDLPAGLLKSPSQDVLLKGENKRVVGSEIERIPLITDPNGVALSIGDVASVRDEFAETTNLTYINGRPALVVEVQKTSDEDLIVVTDAVKKFASEADVPAGYELLAWDDRSIEVKDRINLLAKNALQGLVLVFRVPRAVSRFALSVLGRSRHSDFVSRRVHHPALTGQTINMLSLFGFLMVIGILVDDGIVIGENIYTSSRRRASPRCRPRSKARRKSCPACSLRSSRPSWRSCR